MYAGESGEDLDVLSTGTGNFQLTGEPLFHFNGMFFQSAPLRYSANENSRQMRVHKEATSAGFHPRQPSPRAGRRKRKIKRRINRRHRQLCLRQCFSDWGSSVWIPQRRLVENREEWHLMLSREVKSRCAWAEHHLLRKTEGWWWWWRGGKK